jgi:hypothetical protein
MEEVGQLHPPAALALRQNSGANCVGVWLVPESIRMILVKNKSDYLGNSSLLFEKLGAATWIKPESNKIVTTLTLLFCYINRINQ